MNSHLITVKTIEHYFTKIGTYLHYQCDLTLIGAAPLLLLNANGLNNEPRSTIDIDCWKDSSKFDLNDLSDACIKSGLLFNPKSFLAPTQPYLQLVENEVAFVPSHTPNFIKSFGRLNIYMPPAADLIISKLLRSSPQDIHDCYFLYNHFKLSFFDLKKSLKKCPVNKRIEAEENLTLLKVKLQNI